MAFYNRFLSMLLLAVTFLAASGIATNPAVIKIPYNKDSVMDVRGLDNLPEIAKFLFDRAETVTVTETVCGPTKATETATVAVPVPGTVQTPVPGTVTHPAPSAPETTKSVGTTGVEVPTTLIPVLPTIGSTPQPGVTSETKSVMTTGPASAPTSVAHTGKTTETVVPVHSSSKSTGGGVTVPSGTHTPSATAQPNSGPVKGVGNNAVGALAVGLVLFAAL